MREPEQPDGGKPAARGGLVRAILRWTVRLLVVGVAAIALLIAGMPYLSNLPPVRAHACRIVSHRLNGATVELKTLRFAPIDGRLLQIRGLRISPASEPDRPVAALDALDCFWNPFALLDGELCITEVRAGPGRIRAVEGEGGWNLQELAGPVEVEKTKQEAGQPTGALHLPVNVQVLTTSMRNLAVMVKPASGAHFETDRGNIRGQAFLQSNLSGEGRAWLATSAAGEMGPSSGADGRCRVEMNLQVRRPTGEPVGFSTELEVADVSGTFRGRDLVVPRDIRARLQAAGEVSEGVSPGGTATFSIGDIVSGESEFRLHRSGQWKIEAENSLAVQVSGLAEAVRETLESTGGLDSFGTAFSLRRLSGQGRVLSRSELDVEVPVSGGGMIRAGLGHRLLLDDVDVNVDLKSSIGGEKGQGLRLAVADMDLCHDSVVEGRFIDEIAVRSSERWVGTLGRLKGTAGDAARVALDDVVLSGSASDRLRKDWSAAVTMECMIGRLATRHPTTGEFAQSVDVTGRVNGSNLLATSKRRLTVERLSARLGSLVRMANGGALTAVLDGETLSCGGGLEINLDSLVAMQETMPERVKHMLSGVSVGGRTTGRYEVGGSVAGNAPVEWTLLGRTMSRLDGAQVERDSIRAGCGAGELRAGGGISVRADRVRAQSHWATELELASVYLDMGGASSDIRDASLESAGRLTGTGDGEIEASFDADLKGVFAILPGSGTTEDRSVEIAALSAGATGRAQPRAGKLSIRRMEVVAETRENKVLEASADHFEAEDFGAGKLQGEVSASLHDLSRLRTILPPVYASTLPEISGRAGAEMAFDGEVPLLKKILQSKLAETSANDVAGSDGKHALDVYDPKALLQRACPRDFSVRIRLDDVDIRHTFSDGSGAAVQNLGGRLELARRQDSLEGRLGLIGERIEAPGRDEPLGRAIAESRVTLDDYDRLRLEETTLRLLDGAVRGSANMDVSGLSRLQGRVTVAGILKHLSGQVGGELLMDPRILGDFLPRWSGSGNAGFRGNLVLQAEESLQVETEAEFQDFGLSMGNTFALEGVTTRIPVRKTWRIGEPKEEGVEDFLSEHLMSDGQPERRSTGDPEWEEAGLSPSFGYLTGPDADLVVNSVSVGGRRLLEGLHIDARRTGAGLEVSRGRFRMYDGQVLGRMLGRASEEGLLLRLEAACDGVDTRYLLPGRLAGFKGDSSISGNLHGSIDLQLPPGERPIQGISGRLNVTHIGPRALDRALLALDPESENPNIVRIRNRLQLATPSRVNLELERGFFSLGVDLQGSIGQLATHYSVPRFNVASLLGGESVREYTRALERLTELQPFIRALNADHLYLEPSGTLRFVPAHQAR
mgnify:FL=1